MINDDNFREWIGREQHAHDHVTPVPIAALSATLDRVDAFPKIGDPVPPLWNWLYFLPLHKQSELGIDGHAQRGKFLPPTPLPRRMWAGGRLHFIRPLTVGASITRLSRIADIYRKNGRTGTLMFVRVRHEISDTDGPVFTEEHDILYRGHPSATDVSTDTAPFSRESTWQLQVTPTDVLLFRFSALTFNSHRIHYDRRYATEVEHYPGLVVHGPLTALLLLELLRHNMPKAVVTDFSFRAVSPLFDIAPFYLYGSPSEDARKINLWACNAEGRLAMEATAAIE